VDGGIAGGVKDEDSTKVVGVGGGAAGEVGDATAGRDVEGPGELVEEGEVGERRGGGGEDEGVCGLGEVGFKDGLWGISGGLVGVFVKIGGGEK